ncbi:MAG: hypothetical protein QNJ32_01315 [Xenococcaceae cyanobacterium MO_167.B27]|nr:hypothetical protein [Xenococcaceae cyanobacterium MO_167.B27]
MTLLCSKFIFLVFFLTTAIALCQSSCSRAIVFLISVYCSMGRSLSAIAIGFRNTSCLD